MKNKDLFIRYLISCICQGITDTSIYCMLGFRVTYMKNFFMSDWILDTRGLCSHLSGTWQLVRLMVHVWLLQYHHNNDRTLFFFLPIFNNNNENEFLFLWNVIHIYCTIARSYMKEMSRLMYISSLICCHKQQCIFAV